jgi:Domain of unknown function (DUF4124)
MRRLAFCIILSACAAAWAGTTVYTWVDAQGVTHYSDQPHTGATKLKVGDAPTFSAPPAPNVGTQQPAAPGEHKVDCAIDSPTDQQMLMNAWSVSGHVRVPPAQQGDRVVLMLDGAVLADAADSSGNFNIAQIDRGQHTLAAQVLSASGQVICQAPSITFFVHQPSSQAPNPANRPRF